MKSGMPNKFMDFSPQDFEDFICQLFRDNDYKVERTKYSGDYGVDLIVKKENEHIAVSLSMISRVNANCLHFLVIAFVAAVNLVFGIAALDDALF